MGTVSCMYYLETKVLADYNYECWLHSYAEHDPRQNYLKEEKKLYPVKICFSSSEMFSLFILSRNLSLILWSDFIYLPALRSYSFLNNALKI